VVPCREALLYYLCETRQELAPGGVSFFEGGRAWYRHLDPRATPGTLQCAKPCCKMSNRPWRLPRCYSACNHQVHLADILHPGQQPDGSLLVRDEALERLGQAEPLKMQLIEMRFFGGMTAEESAEALSISVHIVRRELRLAQAWLRKETAGGTFPCRSCSTTWQI
jgi:hypothetical protein